ncbi:MAG: hypothetical protein ACSHYB_08235 [Roseibacillus sp.]
MNLRLVLTLLFSWLLGQSLLAQEKLYGNTYNPKTGTALTVTPMSSTLPSSGFIAVKVNAINGEKIPVTWTFDFTSKDHSYDQSNNLTSSFTLTCSAKKQKNVEFLVPLVTAVQSDSPLVLELRISGTPPVLRGNGEMQNDHSHDWPCILMSEALDTPNSGTLDSAATGGSRYGNIDFAGSFLPTNLSEDWRAFVGFDILMLTSADWKTLTPGTKTALLKWNRLGGRLIIYGANPSVSLPSLGFQDKPESPDYLLRSWGTVELLPLPASSLLDAPSTVTLVQKGETPSRASVFGKELVSSWPLQYTFGERSFNPVFFILILIAFGIIVGPVNLFVFAKSGQRHRLFITTPIISLTASALLLLIIVFQDGFGGKGHRLALIEIQPEENTAYIHQQQIARTGVLLKTSFKTKANEVISPVVLDESRWARITPRNNGGESRYRIGFGDKNTHELSGDWYKSRSEYGHLATSIQATRGRLELLSPNGPPTITSTFDFPLQKIYYLDSSGSIWQSSGPLASGRKTQLSPCPEADFDQWLNKRFTELNTGSKKRLGLVTDRPGHFIALANEGPFIDSLPSLSWKESTALLTGPIVIR